MASVHSMSHGGVGAVVISLLINKLSRLLDISSLHINAQMFFFNANFIEMVEICSASNQYCPRRKEVAGR